MGREKQNKGKGKSKEHNDDDKRRLSNRTGSTTSLGKRRSLGKKRMQSRSSDARSPDGQDAAGAASSSQATTGSGSTSAGGGSSGTNGQQQSSSNISTRMNEYGSQASPMRYPLSPKELTKVAILGAAGGIGQPLSMLMMLHSEYVHHLALYDVTPNVHGVGMDVSHIDRACKITTHLGPDELADAVRDAKVIVIPAGLAQKPGMSRDDLFGSNAKIMFNLAQTCARAAPKAMLAIISNPVNSLVPLTCEVYHKLIGSSSKHGNTTTTANDAQQAQSPKSPKANEANDKQQQQQQQAQQQHQALKSTKTLDGPQQQQQQQQQTTEKTKSAGKHSLGAAAGVFDDCFRRIFGVTTLDVVRASTLTAKSALFKPEPNGLFKDPAKLSIPVIGGHAGKTIMPMLSMASPKLDRNRLSEDKATTLTIVDSIQRAGIDVLNAKKGTGSATLSMAYAACRFTISLLRAQMGEQNIVECAYVRHKQSLVHDLDYFAAPLVLGKDGYVKALPLNQSKLLPHEQLMIEEGSKELKTSIAKGEDFARENLYKER